MFEGGEKIMGWTQLLVVHVVAKLGPTHSIQNVGTFIDICRSGAVIIEDV